MPKIIVVSDSHGLSKELTEIKQRHQQEVDLMIHCGDSELGFDSSQMEAFYKVQGNCDLDERYPEDLDIKVEDLTIFATHGHLYQVKSTLMPLSYRADELGAEIICFGHSHTAGVEKVNQKLFLNPGSIRLPRRITEKTYAMITWNSPDSVHVDFLNLNGDVLPKMSFETNLSDHNRQ